MNKFNPMYFLLGALISLAAPTVADMTATGYKNAKAWYNAPPAMSPIATRILAYVEDADGWTLDKGGYYDMCHVKTQLLARRVDHKGYEPIFELQRGNNNMNMYLSVTAREMAYIEPKAKALYERLQLARKAVQQADALQLMDQNVNSAGCEPIGPPRDFPLSTRLYGSRVP